MICTETRLAGVFVLDIERHEDARGFFARTFCATELEDRGLAFDVSQMSISYSDKRGTLRGMHFQRSPHEETKLVRCTQGAIFDVVIDLRPSSSSYRQWLGLELSADSRSTLYVPRGCAHGFLTLTDASEILYVMDVPYVQAVASGVRWDDPALGVQWPFDPLVMSDRDASYPDFVD